MSFYSNNLGKITAKSGFMNRKQNFMNKENKSPELATYDPFGDKDYKIEYFMNSANHFMGRRP